MTEHTPGKWRACLRPGPNHGHVLAEDWSVIAICPCNIGPIGIGEANTQLVATSPQMLKALKWLLHLNDGVSAAGDGRPVSNDEWESAFEFAQEVFTDATTTQEEA